MDKTRLRIRFSKQGDLRWISHRDLARVWERLLRRANLEMAFSEGFHPKPRISFPSALALGVEALDEIVELEVVGQVALAEIEEDIRREMPEGMELLELTSPEYGLGKAKMLSASYRIPVESERQVAVEEAITAVLSQPEIVAQREKKEFRLPTDAEFLAMRINGEHFEFTIPHGQQGSLRPSELLEAVGLGDLLESGIVLQRIGLQLMEPAKK